jgi:hypothetical protein
LRGSPSYCGRREKVGLIVKCSYLTYANTYDAVAEALRRDDDETVREVCSSAWSLETSDAFAAGVAIADALNRIPKRARVHICRLRLQGPCESMQCSG